MTNSFIRTHHRRDTPTHCVTRIGPNNRATVYRGSLSSCENWLDLIINTNPLLASIERGDNGIKTTTSGGTEVFYFIKES